MLCALSLWSSLCRGEAGADDQQGDQQDNGHDNHIGVCTDRTRLCFQALSCSGVILSSTSCG
nr:Uncharacterised protein [Klebsiella pneumoniae]